MFKKEIGKVIISSGMRRKSKSNYATCKICGRKIKEGDYTITIHKIGEYPTEIHKVCTNKLINILKEAIA